MLLLSNLVEWANEKCNTVSLTRIDELSGDYKRHPRTLSSESVRALLANALKAVTSGRLLAPLLIDDVASAGTPAPPDVAGFAA